jgi:hypothetical protein
MALVRSITSSQTCQFFDVVKKLLIEALDPKRDIIDVHVINIVITQVFNNVWKFGNFDPFVSKAYKK